MQLITPANFLLTGELEMTNSVPLSIMLCEFVLIGLIAASISWLITNKLGKALQQAD
jgi:hypothetical protein